MDFILSILIAFTLGFTGSTTQADTPTQAPSQGLTQALQAQRAQAPNLVRCEEDEPCWDCKTMGNKICGPTQALIDPTTAQDSIKAPKTATASSSPTVQAPKTATASSTASKTAKITPPTAKGATAGWKKFDPAVFTEEELSKPFRVTYRGTTTSPNSLPNGHEWYTVPASGKTHHVFEIEFNSK